MLGGRKKQCFDILDKKKKKSSVVV